MRKVLVTGAAGYIGSVLTRQLLENGYAVRGFDLCLHGGEALLSFLPDRNFEFIKGDVRNIEDVKSALVGVTDVVHLAAIVGDPACAKDPDLATSVNWDGSCLLHEMSQQRGSSISNFVFASTCSNYGKMEGEGYVDENSELSPVSLYAKLKVKFEERLLGSPRVDGFVPTALRFSTVYGLSQRMRFDLTVNEFVKDGALGRKLIIFGKQFWRPYCHVEDLARSCQIVLEAGVDKVAHQVFNVGDTEENYQKEMLAEQLLKILPEAEIEYVSKNEDPRDYRVDFSKIRDVLGYRISKRVPDGMREILDALRSGLISNPDAATYKNI